MSEQLAFRPVVGTNDQILDQAPSAGYVWFATDSKKIYYSDGSSHILMGGGGNSGIFYGKKTFKKTDTEYVFKFDDLDFNGDQTEITIPNIDDLILNTSDGCFYRVVNVKNLENLEELEIQCNKLTVSGGGGGNANEQIGDSSITNITYPSTVLLGTECEIKFRVEAFNHKGQETGDGTYELIIGTNTIRGTAKQNEDNIVPIGEYLKKGFNSIKLFTYMNIGGSAPQTRNKTFNIQAEQMEITSWDNEETTILFNDQLFNVTWKASGGKLEKTVYLKIDDNDVRTLSTYSGDSQKTVAIDISSLAHGAHTFELYATTLINGRMEKCESLKRVFFVSAPGSLDPIIGVKLFNNTLYQYNLNIISVRVYDPKNNKSDLIFYENDVELGREKKVESLKEYKFVYTPMYTDQQKLSFAYGITRVDYLINVEDTGVTIEPVENAVFTFNTKTFANNQAVQAWKTTYDNKEITLDCEKFDWVNGGLQTETSDSEDDRFQFLRIKAGSQLTFNHDIFGSNEASSAGKLIKIIFRATNCRDYDAIVGACSTDSYKPLLNTNKGFYYSLKEGKDYNIGDSVIVNANINLELTNSTELKYNNELLKDKLDNKYIYISNEGIENGIYQCNINFEPLSETYTLFLVPVQIVESFNGLQLNAQSAVFNCPTGESVTTFYCEDQWIELEIEVIKKSDRPYVRTWVDGVLSDYVIYNKDLASFKSISTNLTFGSADCDVDLYLVKVYNKDLNFDEHIQNFVAEAPYSTDIIKRFNRNNILIDGQIDPAALSQNNPDCLVHLYEVSSMPTAKSTTIGGCKYWQYHNSADPILAAENVDIKVQGTSSEKYVLAAANLDSKFKSGFTNPNDPTDTSYQNGWSMDENAEPVNFFCTKVNVASCENANNALNQELYNLFQPYQSVLRCKYPHKRDTMQFTNGVLFIKDKNSKYDGTGASAIYNNVFTTPTDPTYKNNPYFKMYSICNMGNSKKNTKALHDEENPYELCIEVNDNQTLQQKMISCDYEDTDIDDGAKYYGFRYPDGIESLATGEKTYRDPFPEDPNNPTMVDQKTYALHAWRRFVTWMSESNPQPKYDEHVEIGEEQFAGISINPATFAKIKVYYLRKDENNQPVAYEETETWIDGITTYYTPTIHVNGYTNLPLGRTVHYDNKIFSGYKCENQKNPLNNQPYQKDYTPLIKDYTEKQYAGDYTIDNYEYRMAKMLNECENYLVMDSIIYHYLFIERHCMIDNVAKNTFWSTEDGYHWNLIKNYDNDTADGNDNQGKFTRYYGLEVKDKIDDIRYAFNAHESVWLNFIHGIPGACAHMYNQLDGITKEYNGKTIKLWNKDDYLWMFKEWQSKIPERCWNEDYWRKYFRPYEVYGNDMFNSMLAGGQKKYQRASFETYEALYDDSKYHGSTNQTNYLVLRTNGDGKDKLELPVKTYCDCYLRFDVGQQVFTKRIKRNTKESFVSPTSNFNNATAYLFPAEVFTEIGDEKHEINQWGPEQIGFTGAKKLRKLVIGKDKLNNISNGSLKNGLAISGSPLLEELYVSNLTGYIEGLNLSPQHQVITDPLSGKVISERDTEGCKQLKILEAKNSTFTSINLAPNIPLTKLHLNNPFGLVLSNLSNVDDFDITYSGNISQLNLNDIDNCSDLSSLTLTNYLLNNNLSNFSQATYKLLNIKWELKRKDVDNDRIPQLDQLQQCNTFTFNDTSGKSELHQNSLSGQIIINLEDEGESVNTESLYNKYCTMSDEDQGQKTYPQVDIKFINCSNTNNEQEMPLVKIMNIHDEVVWSKRIKKGSSISDSFLASGPSGAYQLEETPSTADKTYSFENEWEIYDDENNLLDTIESAEDTKKPIPADSTITCTINTDVIIKPIYSSSTKTYTIRIMSPEQETPIHIGNYSYGTTIANIVKGLTPYKDDSELQYNKTYIHIGYHQIEDSTSVVDINKATVTMDTTYYAIFKEASVYDNIHEEYFTYTKQAYNDYDQENDPSFYIVDGYVATLKSDLNLRGKITIPATHIDPDTGVAKPVWAVQGFNPYGDDQPNTNITHVFVGREKADDETSTNLRVVKGGTFRSCTALKYFDFPSTSLRQIEDQAFRRTPLKPNRTSTSYYFGDNLYKIGTQAFNQSLDFNGETNVDLIFSNALTSLGSGAFSYIMGDNKDNVLNIYIGNNSGDLSQLNVTVGHTNASEYPCFNFNNNIIGDLLFYTKRYQPTWDQKVGGYDLAEWLGSADRITSKTWEITNGRESDTL